jgi:AGZA family xanthine/uracil permease-like MFS transporter
MGLNAYFAYQVVGYRGTGVVSYNLALTAVFIEGLVFIALSLIGMRQWLVKVIPVSLKIASACGIGLFLAEIGLSYSAGIGAISGAKGTPLQIAGCPPQFLDDHRICTSHKMTSPTVSVRLMQLEFPKNLLLIGVSQMWIGIMCGGVVTAYLMTYKVRSAMIAGIFLVSIMSWP